MNALFNSAWLRTEHRCAVICSWCADAEAASRRAREMGLRVTHTVCDECRERVETSDRGTAQPPEHSRSAPVCSAVASTPSAAAAPIGFLRVHEIAAVCRLDAFELVSRYRPQHWLLGKHFLAREEYLIAESALPDLVAVLSTSEQLAAARALWTWLAARVERQMAREVSVPSANRAALAPTGWLAEWERRNE